ncbi:MAG: matrixin family metalloprotease [Pseudomonadota bacterium]
MSRSSCVWRRSAGFFGIALLLLTGVSSATFAYDFDERTALKWPGATTSIYAGLPNTTASGETLQQAIVDAARQWSVDTPFRFEVLPVFRNPCASHDAFFPGDGFNGQGFATTVCGDEFGDSTVAVTLQYFESNTLGTLNLVEADVVYNADISFDIYDGPLTRGNAEFAGLDFRRTALHELGHVLGLGHEDRVPAIMSSNIGDLDRLQEDDIAGASALYAGTANCPSRPILFGRYEGRLKDGDCRVRRLMSGGGDDSPVDVHTLSLADEATLDLRLTSTALDGVLLLATPGLEVIAMDADSGGSCDPVIRRRVPAGDYVVLVNTWDVAPGASPPCGESVRGDYRLSVSYESERLLTLPGGESFQGGIADAGFLGGVTVNDGVSYQGRVRPNQPFDVKGRIEIDPVHRGQPGFLVMAGITDAGETLVRNPRGAFVPYRPDITRVPVAERRVLSAVESVDVLENMVAQDIGIDDIEVDFFIGYGVDSDPDELYFHSQPINLIVE